MIRRIRGVPRRHYLRSCYESPLLLSNIRLNFFRTTALHPLPPIARNTSTVPKLASDPNLQSTTDPAPNNATSKEGIPAVAEEEPSIPVSIDNEIFAKLRADPRQVWDKEWLAPIPQATTTKSPPMYRSLRAKDPQRRSRDLEVIQREFEKRQDTLKLRTARDQLPIRQRTSEILKMVKENIYSIIVGSTGCGKSTQVPQMILEDAISMGKGGYCNIICTQPRRIAAVSVAERVASERKESIGDRVGYQVRFENASPTPGGSITFQTTGLFLQLMTNPDEVFDNVSHIIIDEVHERSMDIDYLMGILKRAISARVLQGNKVPHIILMSATVDTKLLSDYFHRNVPVIAVAGRTYPVKHIYLEEITDIMRSSIGPGNSNIHELFRMDFDTRRFFELESKLSDNKWLASGNFASRDELEILASVNKFKNHSAGNLEDGSKTENDGQMSIDYYKSPVPISLVAHVTGHICKTTKEGDILIFLPGLTSMEDLERAFEKFRGVDFKDSTRYAIFLLHSILRDGQNKVFAPVPAGCRRIILATNIAETSVTLPEVKHVIDTGMCREMSYDSVRRSNQLSLGWVSKASSTQRAGRAGRVSDGTYWGLYTTQRLDTFIDTAVPEAQRLDLQSHCLDIKTRKVGTIPELLDSLIAPPTELSVFGSILDLVDLGALSEYEELTPLGLLITKIPTHPRYAKLIFLGIIYRCLDPMLTLCAIMEIPSMFKQSLTQTHIDARRTFALDAQCDMIAALNAFTYLQELQASEGSRSVASFTYLHDMSNWNFKQIYLTKLQLEACLEATNLATQGNDYNKHSSNDELIKTLIASVLTPNIAAHVSPPNISKKELKRLIKLKKVDPGDFNVSGKRRMVDKSSVNSHVHKKDHGASRILAFADLNQSRSGEREIMSMNSKITSVAASIFGGPVSQKSNLGFIESGLYTNRQGYIESMMSAAAQSTSATTILSGAVPMKERPDPVLEPADSTILELECGIRMSMPRKHLQTVLWLRSAVSKMEQYAYNSMALYLSCRRDNDSITRAASVDALVQSRMKRVQFVDFLADMLARAKLTEGGQDGATEIDSTPRLERIMQRIESNETKDDSQDLSGYDNVDYDDHKT